MTGATAAISDTRQTETIARTLRAAHEIWLRETNRFLLPVSLREASFWSRWTAIRFLADQFATQFSRERALLAELHPYLQHDAAERLSRDAECITRLLNELDRVGRHRGTARIVLGMSQSLLHLLRSWSADIEAAAGCIPRDVLTPEGEKLLLDFEGYTSIHGASTEGLEATR
jgi:hypothetical protein